MPISQRNITKVCIHEPSILHKIGKIGKYTHTDLAIKLIFLDINI